MDVASDPRCDVAGGIGTADADPQVEIEHSRDQGVPQGPHPGGLRGTDGHGPLEGEREGMDGRHVEGAAAHLTLLTAAYLVAQAAGLGFIAFLLAISLANVTGYVIYAVVLMKLIDRRIGRSTLN